MNIDILVIAAHPDDAELSCGGTILSHINQGKQVGIIDLTKGEMGTRGTPQIRAKEAEEASRILQVRFRDNLSMKDAFFENDKDNQLKIAKEIRKYRPEIIITNATSDRHPDHPRASELVERAAFVSGLRQVLTSSEGDEQEAWRPKAIYHFIQSEYIEPDVVVDISPYWEKKMAAIRAYKSQFHDPESDEPETFISSPEFLKLLESRAVEFGKSVGVKYAEGFTVNKRVGVTNLFHLI